MRCGDAGDHLNYSSDWYWYYCRLLFAAVGGDYCDGSFLVARPNLNEGVGSGQAYSKLDTKLYLVGGDNF